MECSLSSPTPGSVPGHSRLERTNQERWLQRPVPYTRLDLDFLRYYDLCKACGSFIPGVSKLKLGDILAVIRELRAILPARHEHEGLPPILVQVVAGGPIIPYRADEG